MGATTVVAVDPGCSGSVATYNLERYREVKVFKCTSCEDFKELFQGFIPLCQNLFVGVEYIPPTVGFNRPAARMYKLFKHFGYIEGYVESCLSNNAKVQGEVQLITSGVWQKPYTLPKDYAQRKTALWKIAQEQFPNEKVYKYQADSLLLLKHILDKEELWLPM